MHVCETNQPPAFVATRRRFASAIVLPLYLALSGGASALSHERVTDQDYARREAVNVAKLASLQSDQFEQGEFVAPGGGTLAYRLLSPKKSVGRRHAFPIVVFLHGSGAIGTDNRSQLGVIPKSWLNDATMRAFPAFVLAPQVSTRSANYHLAESDGLMASQPGESLPDVLALLSALLEKYPIDRRRIYVVGFSMGGSAAWNAVSLRPDVFAAAVSIGGIPPARTLASRFAKTPLLILHGDADEENSIASDRAMFASLRSLGAKDVRFVEYEGLGHRIPPDMVFGEQWREWLFSKQR